MLAEHSGPQIEEQCDTVHLARKDDVDRPTWLRLEARAQAKALRVQMMTEPRMRRRKPTRFGTTEPNFGLLQSRHTIAGYIVVIGLQITSLLLSTGG